MLINTGIVDFTDLSTNFASNSGSDTLITLTPGVNVLFIVGLNLKAISWTPMISSSSTRRPAMTISP